MQIKVLHLSGTDISDDSRILKTMQCIANSDNDYSVVGLGIQSNKCSSSKTAIENITVVNIKLRSNNWLFLPRVLRHSCFVCELTCKMLFSALRIKPHIVHCNDVVTLPLGVVIKLLTKAKIIYDAHELESNRSGLTKTLGKLTLWVEKRLWRFVNALITVSPSIDKWYKTNVGEKYSDVILNSPVLEESNANFDKGYLRSKFFIPEKSLIYIYIGLFLPGRGLEFIVDAFSSAACHSHLVLLGHGKLAEKFKSIEKTCENIHVHDAVPHEQVISVAKSADIGLCLIENVSLSDYYCLPNKLFEYCFSGIPILASDFPEMKRVVSEYGLGQCCDPDYENLITALKNFEAIKDIPKIEPKKLYDLSWKHQESKLIKLYNRLRETVRVK